MKLLFQTAINAPRQKTQAIVKQACAKAGIEVELKSVVASVFFSLRRGESGYLPALLRRPPDVQRRPWVRPTPPSS